MVSKIRNEYQKRKENNKGAALVLVIIAIAFIGMLVSMILYMSYCNYLMKSNDFQSKDNFYTAEYALEIISTGIQKDISDSVATAYVEIMKDSAGQTTDQMTFDFRDRYIAELKARLHKTETNPGTGAVTIDENRWDFKHLQDMWTANGVQVAGSAGVQGAYLGVVEGGDNTLIVSQNQNYITLSDLYVVYTDEKGYVSVITTDIRIKVPDIDFAQAAAKMTVENYSIIANNSLVNGDDRAETTVTGVIKGSPDVSITGNVFGGNKGVQTIGQRVTRFRIDPDDQVSGGHFKYDLIAEAIDTTNAREAGSGLYVDDSYTTYVNDINVQSSRVEFDGDVFAGDDMDVSGRDSLVRLKGVYRGYGNMYGDSEGSSSILINGADTTLDFSDIDELVLSGHAYVGAKKYDADKDRLLDVTEDADERAAAENSDKIGDSANYDNWEEEEEEEEAGENGENNEDEEENNTIPRNMNDVMMGESISVKANQLMYLVPGDCIGYKAGTNEQVVTQNPMSYDDYKMLVETETEKRDELNNIVLIPGTQNPEMVKVYEPVRLSNLWSKLDGVAYTSKYRAVYRRVNGSVLVYLYLDFGGDEEMANAFFKAYYDYDKEGIQQYVDSYIDSINWGVNLDNSANLTLAGNAFRYNAAGELLLVDDSREDAEKNKDMLSMQRNYSNIYESLMHSLQPDFEAMTGTQQGEEIFDSMVDRSKLIAYSGLNFANEGGTIAAKISTGDVVYPSGCPQNTKLIVTDKDVYVNADFDGLIVAGGNVYVCSSCSYIQYSPAEVLQAMRTFNQTGSLEPVYAYEVFGEKGRLSYGIMDESEEKESIKLRDLISYENWMKE